MDTKTRMFQYKILHNILYANIMLFKFGKRSSPRCSFCKLPDETIMHLFYDCLKVQSLIFSEFVLSWKLILFAVFLHKSNNYAPFLWPLKGTVMQIEKALINDRLHVPKVSWKFRIPTIYNFAVRYSWYLQVS